MINKDWITKNFRPLVFYLFFFFFIIAFNSTTEDYDYDLWARLIIGKFFIQTGQVLKYDFVSYSPTHTLYDHEWGSSIIFYLTHHIFSHVGLFFLQVILAFLIYIFIIKIIKLRGVTTTHPYNFIFYFFSYSAIAMGQMADQTIRCQMFSFLFFAIYLYILELSRKGNNKPLWILPAIMLIWNNLHGGCVSGIGLILIYIVGEIINRKPVKKYLLPFLLTILVLPINPWGFEYITFLIKATTMPRPDITEWFNIFSPFYVRAYLEYKFFIFTMLLFEIIYIIKSIRSKTFNFDATKLIAVFVTVFLSIQHIKHLPFAVITASAFLYDDFYTIFNFITLNTLNRIAKVKDVIFYSLFLIFIVTNISITRLSKPFLSWYKYPLRLVEFIKINDIKGNLFIDFGYGSFTSYKLYPHNKIFIDGRYEEVYYDFMMPMINRFLGAKKNWDDLLVKFPTELIAIQKYLPVFKVLLKHKDWTIVYEDDIFALFVKTKDLKKNYIAPVTRLDYYKDTLFDTNIDFRGKEWKQK